MSFKNGLWTDPDQAELDRIQDSILYPEQPSTSPPVPFDFKDTLNDAVTATVESTKEYVNKRSYDQIKNLSKLFNKKVDIIIPVYNAIHLTEECIRTLYKRTDWPFHLTVVDDASNHKANQILNSLQKEYGFDLLVNKKNHGFASTVNRGVKNSNNPYICLLNSDVLVTEGWLAKMLLAMENDPRNQIVNPATNNTAQINVNIYPGYSYIAMNKAFELYSERRYPEIMPTGFCYLIKRELFQKLGLFSPDYINFGEETSSWMQTITKTEGYTYPGYRAVMADDTYVFHQRSVSFAGLGEDENLKLRKLASGKFHRRWPQFPSVSQNISSKKELAVLRSPLSAGHLNNLSTSKYKICWLVHSVEMCGGMKYIADIVNEINERGGDARVVLIKRNKDVQVNPIAELRTSPVAFEGYPDLLNNFTNEVFDEGIVVASTVELAPIVKQLTDKVKTLKPLLHVQSYEPEMVDDDAMKKQLEDQFKLIPNVIVSSDWVNTSLHNLGVKSIASIPPGIDDKIFYPRNRAAGDDRPTVLIAVRKSYVFKGYERAVRLIKFIHHIADQNKLDIRILTYGVEDIPEAPEAICLGPLSQVRLAETLGKEVDVFIDPSSIHSYGLPALEALVSGCTVVSWDNKGIKEYVQNGKNGVIFSKDTGADKVALKIVKLLASEKDRLSLTAGYLGTAISHNRKTSVDKFINAVEKHFSIPQDKKILVMVPHLRKHGGPTTILDIANTLKEAGHEVLVGTSYSDIEFDVVKMTDIPVIMFDLSKINMAQNPELIEERIPEVDLLISNSDNPLNPILINSKKIKKKIMLKLSHNPRFKALEEEGMRLPWDAVMTSSEWLKNECLTTTKGWNYQPIPEEKVFKIGWNHYAHQTMNYPPYNRNFESNKVITISTLVHSHPSKGTVDALKVLDAVSKLFPGRLKFYGIGEVHPNQLSIKLPGFEYCYNLTRDKLAEKFAQTDIWLGTSHTEGLGRMALEAMSASVACVLTDTGAEFSRHNDTALVAPVGDLKELAKQLANLIGDGQLRQAISINGYNEACKAATQKVDMLANLNKAISYVF